MTGGGKRRKEAKLSFIIKSSDKGRERKSGLGRKRLGGGIWANQSEGQVVSKEVVEDRMVNTRAMSVIK